MRAWGEIAETPIQVPDLLDASQVRTDSFTRAPDRFGGNGTIIGISLLSTADPLEGARGTRQSTEMGKGDSQRLEFEY